MNGATPNAMNPTTLSVWRFVVAYAAEKGYPPTVREIAAGCYLSSSSGAFYHLRKLEAVGILRREPQTARCYQPTGSASPPPNGD